MAQALKLGLLGALPALALAAAAAAQTLPDPTRPPREARVAAPDGAAGAAPAPGLQSVRIAGGRPTALIDGRQVGVGGKVGEARVAGIDETGVTLRKMDGSTEKLRLYPEVTMKPHEPAGAAGRRPRRKH